MADAQPENGRPAGPAHAPRSRRALPPAPDAIQDRYFWRVLNLATVLMMPATLGYAVVYLQRGQLALVAVEMVSTLSFAVIWVMARRRQDALWGLEWMSIAAWVVLATVVLAHGGLRSPALLWLFMLAPLMVLAGSRVAMALAVLTVAFVFAVYAAETAGWLRPFADVPLLQRALSATLILALFIGFARNALAWRQRIADELAQARDAALQAVELKARFIANLNHELRTPLNSIVGSAQLLAQAPDAAHREQLLNALQSSGRHLLQLVNDVLDHSRLEAGKLPLEEQPIVVADLLREVSFMLAPSAEAKGLTLMTQLGPELHAAYIGDVTRLRQVLVNLVSNAIKFTPSGAVTLRAEAGHGEGGPGLRLIVDDSGPGLSDAARDRVFEPYVQEDASINRQHGGTGLGLAICRELVELMGGLIRVQASPVGGARFLVELPLRAARLPIVTAAPSTSDPMPDTPLSVLLVEDNAVNRMVTEVMLNHAGAQVVTAESGAASLERMREMRFDLVLMDLQMPGMDGLSATRLRRAEEARQGWPRTRILALTGEVQEAARAATEAAGMDGFLSKPVALPDLASALTAARRARGPRA